MNKLIIGLCCILFSIAESSPRSKIAQQPVDVPAIQEESALDIWYSVAGTAPDDVQVKGKERRWTCADKSRILLTDEQGGKHCVKF